MLAFFHPSRPRGPVPHDARIHPSRGRDKDGHTSRRIQRGRQSVLAKWARAYDEGSEGFFDSFSKDASIFTISSPTRIDGLEEFKRGFEPYFGQGTRRSQILSPEIKASGDTAVATFHNRVNVDNRVTNLRTTVVLSRAALDPAWVASNLLPQLLDESEDALDLMSVVAQSSAPQYADLFNLLKPAIFRALEHEQTDEAVREQLCGTLVGAALSTIAGFQGFELTAVECRHALTRMPASVLSRMAWELGSMLREREDGPARAGYWDAAIAPFLRNYWPNDVAVRTAEVSKNLIRLPALADEAFERAVELILDLVRPIQRYELRFGLGLDEEGELIARYPRALLKLVVAVLDRAAPPPSDIAALAEKLLRAEPQIAADPAFWRLRTMRRADR